MHLSRRNQLSPNTKSTYRPQVEALEDRLVPAVFRALTPPPPLPATHFQVLAPSNVMKGQTFNVTVQALDARNQLATGFRGTTIISLGTADAGAILPTSFIFSALDKGSHTFQMSLAATGLQTVKARRGLILGQ